MSKFVFPTQYDVKERVSSVTGTGIKDTFKLIADDYGVIDVRPVGKKNLYAEIQSHADSVDIHVILEKFCSGDESVLHKTNGAYMDLTEFPTTYAELLQKSIDAENYFYGLPLEVRKEFNHSASEFFASIGTKKFFDVFGKPVEKPVESVEKVVESEVKVDE